MFNGIKRATRAGVLGAGLLALLAGPTTASGAEVSVGRESLDGVAHDFMICQWEATFTTTGQVHWTVAIDDEHHGHVTLQEAVSYTLVIDDDSEVPASLRGATWRGHNVISFVTNFDPASEREITRQVQPSLGRPLPWLDRAVHDGDRRGRDRSRRSTGLGTSRSTARRSGRKA